jgi:hypothetical protein
VQTWNEILHNEEGSALATVLAISVIILLFIGAVLSGVVLQARFIQQDIHQTQARYLAEAGIYRLLHDSTLSFHSIIDLAHSGENLKVTANSFGGFWDIQSTGKAGNQKQSIRVLVGERAGCEFNNAIVVGDSTSGLTITGLTDISGTMVLNEEGYRTSSFKGVPFRGAFDGELRNFRENEQFPVFYDHYLRAQIDRISEDFESGNLATFEVRQRELLDVSVQDNSDTLYIRGDLIIEDELSILSEDELTLFVEGNLTINNAITIPDYSKIIARDSLRINGSLIGSNIFLYGGTYVEIGGTYVEIGGTTLLGGQVLSSGSIVIKDQSYLSFPSLVYSSKEFFAGGSPDIIELRDEAIVDGSIIYSTPLSAFQRDNMRIHIDTTTTLRGGLYNAGQTELHGTVLGSVLTQQFYFYESPTSYINWLKDVTIDVTQRPPGFVVPIGFSEHPRYEIVDWRVIE